MRDASREPAMADRAVSHVKQRNTLMNTPRNTAVRLSLLCATLLAVWMPTQAHAVVANTVQNTQDATVASDANVIITSNDTRNGNGDISLVRNGTTSNDDTRVDIQANGVVVNKDLAVSGNQTVQGSTTTVGNQTVQGALSAQGGATLTQSSANGTSRISGSSTASGVAVTSSVSNASASASTGSSLDADGRNAQAALQVSESGSNASVNVNKTGVTLSQSNDNGNGSSSVSVSHNQVRMGVSQGGAFQANDTSATATMGHSALVISDRQAGLGVQGGGVVQVGSQSASLSGSGRLAGNGTGTAVAGVGGVTVYNTVQTIQGGTTINNALAGKQYQNQLNGNTYVDGNLYINGTLDYVSKDSASTKVVGQDATTSKLDSANQAVQGGTRIVVKGSAGAAESSASLTLTNGIGNAHGVEVYEDRTQFSGGTHSTDMVLDDGGAHFSNRESGGPVKVTGVADGTSSFDAVNYRQLQALRKDMAQGIASAVAMSNIPQVDQNKRFSVGVGIGGFDRRNALAAGVSVRLAPNAIVNARVATSNGGPVSYGAGAALSW